MTLDHNIPIDFYMTRQTHTVGNKVTCEQAQALMKEHSCRHLPVLEGGKLVGILSERDFILAAEGNADWGQIAVGDVANDSVYTVAPSTPLSEVAQRMSETRYGCAVVKGEGQEVLGIFTTTDACRALAAALET
jgi:acetoin utilization protein AcuB